MDQATRGDGWSRSSAELASSTAGSCGSCSIMISRSGQHRGTQKALGRQQHQREVVWHDEVLGAVPSGPVHQHDPMGSGSHGLCDFRPRLPLPFARCPPVLSRSRPPGPDDSHVGRATVKWPARSRQQRPSRRLSGSPASSALP